MALKPKSLQISQVVEIPSSKINCLLKLENIIIAGTTEGELKYFSLSSDPNLRILKTDLYSISILLKYKENSFFVAGENTIQICSITIENSLLILKKINSLSGHSDQITGLGLIGEILYSASEDSKVLKWDLNNFKHKEYYQHDSAILSFDANDEKGVVTVVSCCAEPRLKVYQDGSFKYDVNLEAKIWSLRVLHGGILGGDHNGILGGDHNGNLVFIDQTGVTKMSQVHESRIKCIDVNLDSKKIFTASFDQKVAVSDFELNVKAVGNAHDDWIRTVKVDGNRILTAGDDSKVIIWELEMEIELEMEVNERPHRNRYCRWKCWEKCSLL